MRSGVLPGERLRDVGAYVVRHDADARDAERVQQSEHVRGMRFGAGIPGWSGRRLARGAEAAQVGGDQVEAPGQAAHARRPGQPELRPAMQQ